MACKIEIKSNNSPVPDRTIRLENILIARRWFDDQQTIYRRLGYEIVRNASLLKADYPETGAHVEMTLTIISDEEFKQAVAL